MRGIVSHLGYQHIMSEPENEPLSSFDTSSIHAW